MAEFPSMKGRDLLGVLQRSPLDYAIKRQRGSHRVLTSPDRPRLIFAFHDGDTVGGSMVRKVLVKDVGLSEEDALELL